MFLVLGCRYRLRLSPPNCGICEIRPVARSLIPLTPAVLSIPDVSVSAADGIGELNTIGLKGKNNTH